MIFPVVLYSATEITKSTLMTRGVTRSVEYLKNFRIHSKISHKPLLMFRLSWDTRYNLIETLSFGILDKKNIILPSKFCLNCLQILEIQKCCNQMPVVKLVTERNSKDIF